MKTNPITQYKKLAVNQKATQAARIRALRFLDVSASYALLRKIIDNPASPGRLVALAVDLFAMKVALRQEEMKNATTD
jgi:hypothetical protein